MEKTTSELLLNKFMQQSAGTKSVAALMNVKDACDRLVEDKCEITIARVGQITEALAGGPALGTIRSNVSGHFIQYIRSRHAEQNPPRQVIGDALFAEILPRLQHPSAVRALWNVKDACDALLHRKERINGVNVAKITGSQPGGPTTKTLWGKRVFMDYVQNRGAAQKQMVAEALIYPGADTPPQNSISSSLRFPSPEGRDFHIILNQSAGSPLVLNTPESESLIALLTRMESDYISSFWEKGLTSASPYDKNLPYGLSASSAGHSTIPFQVVHSKLTGTNAKGITKKDISKYSIETLKQVILALKPHTIAEANLLLTENGRIRFNVFSLIDLARKQSSFQGVVGHLLAVARSGHRCKGFALSTLVAMRSMGWILLPVESVVHMGRVIRGLNANENAWTPHPENWLSPELSRLYHHLLGEVADDPDHRTIAVQMCKARLAVMCSNIRGLGDISVPFVNAVLFNGKSKKHTIGYNFAVPAAMRARWNKLCQANGPAAMGARKNNDHMAALLERCPPDPRLKEWIALLTEQMDFHLAGNLEPIYKAYGLWLTWLSTLPDVPKPMDIQRKYIRNETDPTANTFKSFLACRDYESAKDRNLPLAKMAVVFDRIAADAETDGRSFPNPIRYSLDKFVPPRRKQSEVTPRPRIPDMDIEELKAITVAVDKDGTYKWGAGLQQIACLHIETGKGAKVFCPIMPAILYSMLVYPLRTHQARWLDSGELDEDRYDFKTKQFVNNQAGESGRKSGVIQPLDGRSIIPSDLPLEFQIPINKVLLRQRNRSEFIIPYFPPDLCWVIQQVLEWQERNGPSPHLVKEVHEPVTHQQRNQKMADFYPDICPLFRYPGQESFYPPTHAQINYFWGKLCRLYDDRNAAWVHPKTGKKQQRPGTLKLSRIYTGKYGTGTWDYPVFDLHSLRVASVSRLLDAGLPLAVVASIAGHRSLAMTLHYYKAERAVLRLKISEALQKLGKSASLTEVSRRLQDCEDAESWLRSTSEGFAALRQARKTGLLSFSISGICPGTSCENGLDKQYYTTHGRDVPGSRCALCKYFIYGPPFLIGLAYEYNCLLFELEKKANRQNELRAAARKAVDAGNEVEVLQAKGEDDRLDRETSLDLKVLARLYSMIDECLALINGEGGADGVELVVHSDIKLAAVVESVSKFTQLKDLAEIATIIPVSRQISSDIAKLELKDMLLDFLRVNGVECYLAGISKTISNQVTLQLARVIERLVPQDDTRQKLLDGVIKLKEMPAVQMRLVDHINESIRRITTESPNGLALADADKN
jgi:hypothetical protein